MIVFFKNIIFFLIAISLFITLNSYSQNVVFMHNNDKCIETKKLTLDSALSFYNSFKNTNITVKFRCINTSMQARPQMSYLFKKNNEFLLVMNNNLSRTGIDICNLPFDALIGLFGHELAHLLQFQQMTDWQINTTGIKYLSKKNKRMLETKTDSIAIINGLGKYILSFRNYIDTSSTISASYKKKKTELYLTADDIKRIMNNTHR